MTFFDDNFSGVRKMLEADIAKRETQAHEPWCIVMLELGRPVVQESFATEAEARAAFEQQQRTCAPFIRDAFWVEHRP